MRIRLFLASLTGFIGAQNLANGLFADTGLNAGFISRINQKVLFYSELILRLQLFWGWLFDKATPASLQGFDLMADYLGERVKRFLGAGELIFNISAPVPPEMRITILSMRVTEFDSQAFASKMIVIPEKGIAWQGSNLNVTVLASFHLDTPTGELTGSSPLSFDRTNVELLLWTGVNADGHLKTDLVLCKVAANNVDLTLDAADKPITTYMPVIIHFIKERIEQGHFLWFYSSGQMSSVKCFSRRNFFLVRESRKLTAKFPQKV
ncbi:unnamed protein product [Haemonchus placei]|uniref:BPI2 domain-containing protein n=1 Tax=Haemonchus placei TaxID=6290 RepID=A0A0N4WSD1_HAEPC|nr:unnamed protein product [Haemonchus placei]